MTTEAKKTVLFEKHAALAGKAQIVPFAGWMMPLWYQSISAEHAAVRNAAGVFDCTHMAVLKVSGKDAANFLNVVSTNDISMLKPGKAQYSYILNPAGQIIDDIIIYCIKDDNFMVVANASNEQNVKNWLNIVTVEKIDIDPGREYQVTDLKNPSLPDAKVDIALQGPASAKCLEDIFAVDVSGIKPLHFVSVKAKGYDLIVSRTGYTGAKVGFELFVHPDKAGGLWDIILEEGKKFGVVPCGLGARDSLRIEAGLPLYGHELAGDFSISPFQAGYDWAVKLEKKCFIGKEEIMKKLPIETEVARFKFDGSKGIRPIRQLDGLVNKDGRCIGNVLSCAKVEDKQVLLGLVKKGYAIFGDKVGVYYLARNKQHIEDGKKDRVAICDRLIADMKGLTVDRFEKF
ncbi:MAG: glycine cleavage system aminomethyltransferase GcvT [Phycisphaerae bacterium]|nr:glycine cleavage system aminomethyltransferase GcvT [Phycisphaerae bacterium]